jgi:hypothetical protein
MNNRKRKRKRKETKRKKISPPLRFPLFFIVLLLHATADDWSGGGKMVYKEKESFLS